MGKYRVLGAFLDRVFRNDLNANFNDVDTDIKDQKKRVDDLILANPQPSEVQDARGGFAVLRDRLDDTDAQLAETTTKKREEKSNDVFRNVNQGLVTFIDDDAKAEVWTNLKPIFDAKGVKCTIAVSSDLFDINGYLSTQQILDLQNSGWEVASHGKTHTELALKTFEEQEIELKVSLETLESKGFKVESIVFPYGSQNADTRKLVKKYYRSGVNNIGSDGANGVNKTPVKQLALNRVGLGSFTPTGRDTLAAYKESVDYAKNNNAWLIFMTHIAVTDATQQQYLSDTIQYCLDSNVPIVTLKEGLNRFGNVFQVGDNYNGDENNFVIGADFRNNKGNIRFYKDHDAISLNTLPDGLPKDILIYSTFSTAYASDPLNNVPDGQPGTLITETFRENGFKKQTYKLHQSNKIYIRTSQLPNSWSKWEDARGVRYLGNNAVSLSTLPLDLPPDLVIYSTFSGSYASDAANNVPEGKPGTLITETFNEPGYKKQTYKVNTSHNTYERTSQLVNSWGRWRLVNVPFMTTTERTAFPVTQIEGGFCVFDKNLNKPVWRNANNNGWVDSNGNTI